MSLLLLFNPSPGVSPPSVTAVAYVLGGISIQPPHRFSEANDTLYAENRVLEGDINRDFFGENKRVWDLEYENLNPEDSAIIKALYYDYLDSGETKTWEVTGDNYFITETSVHIDLPDRTIHPAYITSFVIRLTEA